MFGLSFWEIAIILAVALIILGPSKLPELAKTLGRGIREFRRATDDFKAQVDHEMMDEPEVEPPRALPNGKAAPDAAGPVPAAPDTMTAASDTVAAGTVPAGPDTAVLETEVGAAAVRASDHVAGPVPAEDPGEVLERPPVEEKKADA